MIALETACQSYFVSYWKVEIESTKYLYMEGTQLLDVQAHI